MSVSHVPQIQAASAAQSDPAPQSLHSSRPFDWAAIAVVGVFLLSRALAFGEGVRIDLTDAYQWQLLDPTLLRTRLLESLWYLHSQPPLFNALHGAVLKVASSPHQGVMLWTAIQLAAGVAMTLSIYAALRLLRASLLISALVTLLFVCSPASIVYESFLSYTFLDAALLSGAIYLLIRSLRRHSHASMWAFFLVLAVLCLTRAAYQIVWLLVVSASLLLLLRRSPLSRTVLQACVVASLAVGSLYVKNLILFGTVSSSSWAGMNLATMTHTNLREEQRRPLVGSGTTSPLTLVAPFQPLSTYPAAFRSRTLSGVPVLDQLTRFDGSPNFNNRDYIGISKQFGRDAVKTIGAYPGEYLRSVARNLAGFLLRSDTDYHLISGNVSRIERWDAFYSVLVYGQLGSAQRLFEQADEAPPGSAVLKHVPLQEVVRVKARESCWFVLLFVIGLPLFAVARLEFGRPDRSDENAVLAFLLITFGYLFLATNLVNFGESNRMRFEMEPLLVVLLGWFASDWRSGWRVSSSRGL